MPDVIHVDFGQRDMREGARYAALRDRTGAIGSPELGTTEEWGFSALQFLKVRYCEANDTTMMFVPKDAYSCLAVFFEEMAVRLGIIETAPGAA